MKLNSSIRSSLALLLLVCPAFCSQFAGFTRHLPSLSQEPAKDSITSYEESLAGLKAMLPKNDLVGYITDSDQTYGRGFVTYHLLQYTVSPVRVEYGTPRPWMIGRFLNWAEGMKIMEKRNLILVKKFENDFYLLRAKTAND